MSNFFDIRTRIPDYGQHRHRAPEPEAYYNEINLMCYLLRGIRYGVLYRVPLVQLLDEFRRRVAQIPIGLANAAERDAAIEALNRFITALENEPTSPINFKNLTLRMLYMTYPRGANARVDELVRRNFEALNRASNGRLCLPFLDRTGKTTLKEMNDHIQDLGSCDLQDLYELPKRHFPEIGRAVVRDRNSGILVRMAAKAKDPGKGKKGIKGGGGGNNYRKCVDSVCTPVTTNSFCNATTDGTCSVASD